MNNTSRSESQSSTGTDRNREEIWTSPSRDVWDDVLSAPEEEERWQECSGIKESETRPTIRLPPRRRRSSDAGARESDDGGIPAYAASPSSNRRGGSRTRPYSRRKTRTPTVPRKPLRPRVESEASEGGIVSKARSRQWKGGTDDPNRKSGKHVKRIWASCRVEKYNLPMIWDCFKGTGAEWVDSYHEILYLQLGNVDIVGTSYEVYCVADPRDVAGTAPTSPVSETVVSEKLQVRGKSFSEFEWHDRARRVVKGSAVAPFPPLHREHFKEDDTIPHTVETPLSPEGSENCAFVFASGSVVIWGPPSMHAAQLQLQFLNQFADAAIPPEMQDDEVILYEYISELERSQLPKTRIANGRIYLKSHSKEEKLAISFAFAQSARLAVCEGFVEHSLHKVQEMQAQASASTVTLDDTDMAKRIGELFSKRMDVNLVHEIVDVPEYFWNDDTWQPFYASVHRYLSLNERMDIINHRYQTIYELYKLVRENAAQGQATRVMWIIIFLLAVQLLSLIIREFVT